MGHSCHIMLFSKTQTYDYIIFPLKVYYRLRLPNHKMKKDIQPLLFDSFPFLSPSQVLYGPVMSIWLHSPKYNISYLYICSFQVLQSL